MPNTSLINNGDKAIKNVEKCTCVRREINGVYMAKLRDLYSEDDWAKLEGFYDPDESASPVDVWSAEEFSHCVCRTHIDVKSVGKIERYINSDTLIE